MPIRSWVLAAASSVTLTAALTGCASTSCCAVSPTNDTASAKAAHHAYNDAINANDLDAVLDRMTDDVVFLPPNGPRVVGKDAVREWATPYMAAYTVHWDKTELEFLMLGNGWAFEQYAYVEHDIAKDGSAPLQDTGKGAILWKLESDGQWRVARDIWCSDLAPE